MNRGPNRLVRVCFWGAMLFLYTPLVYLVIQAFLTDPNNLYGGFTLKWLIRLFETGSLWEPLLNSLWIGVGSATLSVMVGLLGAVGLLRINSLLPVSLQTLIMLPMLLPEVITGLSLMLLFLVLEIPLGMVTVVIAHASFSASFVYFILLEQLKKVDPQIEEAASDLGAGGWETFWKVTVPNILPGIMGGWLLAFTLSFDDFLISFFTAGSGLTTLPLKIYSLLRVGLSPDLNALTLLMIFMSTGLVLLMLSREQSRKWMLKG